ncbi:MAG TPA: thymidylate kinase [Chthoniobacteraceae bacterium]|jgi:dTMP kinase|nr:Thymidylate kinase [Chthoniobacter sp.]HEV7868452.1 thymidylate kinase [Chthoniobacteraceae bacterium]
MPIAEKKFFGRRLPELQKAEFSGRLFAIEGPDGSGRSTQIAQISAWLEANGFAVRHVGLRRSNLVGEELDEAKQGNVLTHTTLSLFYATDFFDQLVHELIPALRAGLIVLADRYVYTLMARDITRGAEREWTRNLYSPALVPDAVFYLRVGARQLVERNFQKSASLDYWESGMDLGLSRDMFDSFIKYQRMLQAEFQKMQKEYGFQIINANLRVESIQKELRKQIGARLGLSTPIQV